MIDEYHQDEFLQELDLIQEHEGEKTEWNDGIFNELLEINCSKKQWIY